MIKMLTSCDGVFVIVLVDNRDAELVLCGDLILLLLCLIASQKDANSVWIFCKTSRIDLYMTTIKEISLDCCM